jgi:hypothetical protein
MKKYIYTAVLAVILGLSISLYIAISTNNKYKKSIDIYDNNFKALNLKYDSLSNETIAYKFEVEQLEYINDSIVNKLDESRKELKIKDRDLKPMQYILSEGNKTDTIIFKDTVFRDNFIKIDTTLGDKWVNVKLESLNPNTLSYNIKYTSELEVFAYTEKEIIGTPKKCFIGRWFQRKHKVTKVDVKDNNPYATIKNKKFIIIN